MAGGGVLVRAAVLIGGMLLDCGIRRYSSENIRLLLQWIKVELWR